MSLILNTSYTEQTITTVEATTITREQPLSTADLAHACGADADWVAELVALGIAGQTYSANDSLAQPACFDSADLQCALEASRLQRDFGVSLDAAALILDLQHEVRRLKASLQALGLS